MAAAMFATIAVLAGCGTSHGAQTSAAPLEFHDGFARVVVPLSAREVEPAAGGHWVLVYGGVRFDGGGHAFADGALYDVETQSWSSVADAPFDAPLWAPATLWTGREFVVLGTPCADPDVDDENVDFVRCGARQPVAAAFDPAVRRWRAVSVPDVGDLAASGNVLTPQPVGVANGRAVFAVVPPDLAHPLQLVSIAPGAEPTRIAPPTSAKHRCALGDRLFAFGSGDDAVVPTPAGRVEPTHTWSYVDGNWVEGGGLGPSTTETYGYIGGVVSCSPSAVGLVGVAGADGLGGRGGEVDWFDPSAGWRRLPPVEPEHLATEATVAERNGTPLVWIGDRISLLREGTWSSRTTAGYLRLFPSTAPPISSPSGTGPIITRAPELASTDRYLVGRAYVERTEAPVLVFLDVDGLPLAQPRGSDGTSK